MPGWPVAGRNDFLSLALFSASSSKLAFSVQLHATAHLVRDALGVRVCVELTNPRVSSCVPERTPVAGQTPADGGRIAGRFGRKPADARAPAAASC